VIDDGSTDRTEAIVKGFASIRCQWIRNPKNLGLFENFNRCLDLAVETEYLHILHADDLLAPQFYETMTRHLEDCPGFGIGWCLDERIDEIGRHLSISGRHDGRVRTLGRDRFLAKKAEIGNQAFCATLMKTNHQPVPVRFPTDMPILGDMVFWAKYGTHCRKIVTVNRPLAKFRCHRSNQTFFRSADIDALVQDEWRTMQIVEAMREKKPRLFRKMKLKGLLAVRAGIKAKRFRQLGNHAHGAEIARTARSNTGMPLWLAGQLLVELREWCIFKIGGRRRHPRNVFS